MKHENYTGKIKDYVNGVEHDLENVAANEGHDLVKISILEQVKRLADIATHNSKFLVTMIDEFLTMTEKRHHEQLMKEFNIYLKWGLDAVDHFDETITA